MKVVVVASTDLVFTAVQLSRIVTERIAILDLHNKLALLSVLRGLKPSFAYGLGEDTPDPAVLEGLRDWARNAGLTTLLSEQPALWEETFASVRVPPWFLKRFAAMSTDVQSPAVLWVGPDSGFRQSLESAEANAAVGGLLGYPACCVAVYERRQEVFLTGLYEAFKTRYGPSQKRILAALEGDWPDHSNPGIDAAGLSLTTYPYVFHVACDSCLLDGNSPTAGLNEIYRQVASECGAEFYGAMNAAIEELRKIEPEASQ